MGESKKMAFRVHFDRRLRLEFYGSRITSDAGLPACRELDDTLGLTESGGSYLKETLAAGTYSIKRTPLKFGFQEPEIVLTSPPEKAQMGKRQRMVRHKSVRN